MSFTPRHLSHLISNVPGLDKYYGFPGLKPFTTLRTSTRTPSPGPLENRAGVMGRGAGNACSPRTRIVRGRSTGA